MRILYVIDSLAPGGAEMSLAEMAPQLIRGGVDLHVLSLGRRLDLKERLESAGAEVHVGPNRLSRRTYAARTAQVVSSINPALVHTTLFEANVAGRIAARLRGVPSSTSFVGDTYGREPASRIAQYKLLAARLLDLSTARFASRFHAVSEHLASAISFQLKLPRDAIEVIPRGRDKERFPYRPLGVREEIRNELGLTQQARIVVAVGRLERVKGLEYLMQALPKLASSVPDIHVLVAGKEGAAASEVRAAAGSSGMPVSFLGHRQDVGRLLAAADVLAFPSLSEGSPGTLIEAMASGCPVVASDIPPNLEVLGRGNEAVGLTVPVRDPDALAQALTTSLTESMSTQRMARLARQRFERKYEITEVSERMVAFFRAAAQGRGLGLGEQGL